MKTATSFLFLVALLVGACSDGGPVGFVNLSTVINDSNAGREFVAEQGDADRADQLKEAADEAVDAAKKAADAKAADAKGKQAAADRAVKEFNAEVKRRQSVGARFEERVTAAIARVASDRKMTLVIPLQAKPPFAAPKADVTGDVIARLDSAWSDVTKLRADLAAARAEAEAAKKKAKP